MALTSLFYKPLSINIVLRMYWLSMGKDIYMFEHDFIDSRWSKMATTWSLNILSPIKCDPWYTFKGRSLGDNHLMSTAPSLAWSGDDSNPGTAARFTILTNFHTVTPPIRAQFHFHADQLWSLCGHTISVSLSLKHAYNSPSNRTFHVELLIFHISYEVSPHSQCEAQYWL